MSKSKSKSAIFDYETKLWGSNEVGLNPVYLGATRFKYVLEALKNITKGSVLEVGCGAGTFARAIKRYRKELSVEGCDLSQNSIVEAKKIGGEIKYRVADIDNLPYKSESFDAVVSFDVWEHLLNPQKAFRDVKKVLKPGGTLHFFMPTEGNKWCIYKYLPSFIYGFKKEYTGHIHPYTSDQMVKMVTEAGYKVTKVHNSSYYIYQIVDSIYFFGVKLKGRNVGFSVEGYLTKRQYSLTDWILYLAKIVFGWLTYLEDIVFQKIPGGGVHITAVKVGK